METKLNFEKSLQEIENKIDELINISKSSGLNLDKEIEMFKQQAKEYKIELYNHLNPSQKIQIARHSDRPNFTDFVNFITNDFIELHGDREGCDDRAIIGGIADIEGKSVILIGTQKGKTTKENLECNFGMPQPQGYRKALRLFNHAERFKLPIITLIDTPGAYPGIKAEETGQGIAIATNLREMAKLTVPVISVITGEGCSGGALALAVANKVLMLEHAYYTVISPEGCASILWRDAKYAADAAKALKITANDLLELKVIDEIVNEPVGGAHVNHQEMADTLKEALLRNIDELKNKSPEELKTERYNKFRDMGVFIDG